jgi:hypothetical protein
LAGKKGMKMKNLTDEDRERRVSQMAVTEKDVIGSDIAAPSPDVIHRFLTGRPMTYATEEELRTAIEEYFNSLIVSVCDENGVVIGSKWRNKPTVGGMAVYLGIDRSTLHRYSKSDPFYTTIKKAKDLIHSFNEQMLTEGKNPVGAINTLINTSEFWVSDQKNIRVEPVMPDNGAKTTDEITAFLDDKALPES